MELPLELDLEQLLGESVSIFTIISIYFILNFFKFNLIMFSFF